MYLISCAWFGESNRLRRSCSYIFWRCRLSWPRAWRSWGTSFLWKMYWKVAKLQHSVMIA